MEGPLTDRAEQMRRIASSLEAMEDWQLELVARAASAVRDRGYGIPPYLLGLGKLQVEGGVARGRVEIGEVHLAGHGAAHGMVAFGMLDNAMGRAVIDRSGEPRWAAVEIKVQFLRPLGPGPAVVEGRAVHVGGRIAVTEGRVLDAAGRPAVLASGTYYRTGRPLRGT